MKKGYRAMLPAELCCVLVLDGMERLLSFSFSLASAATAPASASRSSGTCRQSNVRETSDCSTVGSSGCSHVKKHGPRHSCLSVHIEQVTAGCPTWLSNALVMKDRLYQLYRAITQLRISIFTSANPCSMGFNSGG